MPPKSHEKRKVQKKQKYPKKQKTDQGYMFKRSNSQIHFYDKDKKSSQESRKKAETSANISIVIGKDLKI